MSGEILEADVALAFLRAPVAQGQQAGQALVGLEIGRIDEQGAAVACLEAAADQQPDPVARRILRVFLVARGRERAHHPRQRVAVGDADGGMAEFDRPLDQLLGMRAAAQEAVIGRDLQLGVVHGSGIDEFVRPGERYDAYWNALVLQRLQEFLVGADQRGHGRFSAGGIEALVHRPTALQGDGQRAIA